MKAFNEWWDINIQNYLCLESEAMATWEGGETSGRNFILESFKIPKKVLVEKIPFDNSKFLVLIVNPKKEGINISINAFTIWCDNEAKANDIAEAFNS